MLLAIDAGNTQTVIGLFGSAAARGQGDGGLVHHWRVATDAERTADEHALMVAELLRWSGYDPFGVISGAAISSTVPRLQVFLRDMVEGWFGVPAVVVEPGVRTGMPILYENPRDVGADRIANAVAAFDGYPPPIVVVDFGTATTFDVVSGKGEYLGGAILPGIEISLDALFARASMLRRVQLAAPRQVVGRSTVESIQSGTVLGYASLTDGMCRRIQDEVGPASVVATGGLAELVAPQSATIQHHDPWLTLHGLRLIWERNCGAGRERGNG
ncbi:MAG TPA: type III pantothenate kinase [Acidimicrobiales bacterium]|nr:type III pantothenate kinase [Acidimicrobiales bacterium]